MATIIKKPDERDAYSRAEVGIRPAAHAIGAGVRELPGQFLAAAGTAGKVVGGVAGSAPQVARGLSYSTGNAARNVAATDFQGAGSRFADAVGQTATGLGRTIGPPAAQLARRGVDGVANAALDRVRPYVEAGSAMAAGFRGDPLSNGPGAGSPAAVAPPAGTAEPAASRAPLLLALAQATGDAIRGVRATMRQSPAAAPDGGVATASGGGIGAGFRGPGYGVANTIDGVARGLANPRRPHGPGASNPNYFIGKDGVRQEMRPDGTMQRMAGTGGAPVGGLARPVPGGSVSYMSGAPTAPAQNLSLARPTVQFEGTRTAPNPSGARASLLDGRSAGSEMARRSDIAASRLMDMARAPKGTYTAAQLRAAGEALGTSRQFWADQAASIGSDAQARFMQAQGLQSQEGQSAMREGGANARAMLGEQGQSQRSAAELAARQAMDQQGLDAQMQMEELRQAGADRRATRLAELQRPQQPITLGDGTMAAIGPDGTLQPYTLPDGSTARAPMGQPGRDYGRESSDRMFTDLLDMQRGPDGTLAPDAVERAMSQMQQYRSGVTPPVPGARQAPDGNWYVQQNGSWSRVDG